MAPVPAGARVPGPLQEPRAYHHPPPREDRGGAGRPPRRLSAQNCMVMVEQSQVWAGSEDSVIYVLNVHSMSCSKQLTDHRHSVTGLVLRDTQGARWAGALGRGGRGAEWLPACWGGGVQDGRRDWGCCLPTAV